MSSVVPTDSIVGAINVTGLLHNLRIFYASSPARAIVLEGEAIIRIHRVLIRVELDSEFPLHLPRIILVPWDALGYIPHVDTKGTICFADTEGILIKWQNPQGVVVEALKRAIAVLEAGVTGQNRRDFVEEFEAHWNRLEGSETAFSLISPKQEVHRVVVVKNGHGKAVGFADSDSDLLAFDGSGEMTTGAILERALYVPLMQGTEIIPPRPDSAFWTVGQVRRILMAHLMPMNQKKLRRLLKRRKYRDSYILFGLPRFSGGETIFGIRYEQLARRHPLRAGGDAAAVMPIRLIRVDRNYIVRRGGATSMMSSRRVLLVGCGAVGGHLAVELARTGILDLTFVDPDELTPDNTFRHVLGRRYWGDWKAEALKTEIEAQLPYVKVTSFVTRIEELLSKKLIDLSNYDLLVLATGNPTVELKINELIHKHENLPPAVFTWLEPLGIGGHALLANNATTGGCFECLYTSVINDTTFDENRAAFAAAGQAFGRALSGCGSLHTPYGSLDACQTATTAVRLAINVLTGRESGNPLVSWKGDSASFLKEGFLLSPRYDMNENELSENRYLHITSRCRVCGSRQVLAP
jgi:molybdopterin-synthase adenylyltransferase